MIKFIKFVIKVYWQALLLNEILILYSYNLFASMQQIESSESQGEQQQCNSSFHSLRLSGNQNEGIQEAAIVPYFDTDDYPQKSLRQSVQQTYKICCSNLRTIKTNIAYNFRHSKFQIFTKRQKVILSKSQSISLLGRNYRNNSEQKEQFYVDFNNIIWLTYRSGISGLESDAGWGCMIRVCQMVLAQTFKRVAPQIPLKQVIEYFKDTSQAQFSLTRICQYGQINERWTSSIQIFTLLRSMLFKFKKVKLSLQIFSCCIQIESLKELEQIEYPCLVFVSNRLGKNQIDMDYKQHFLELMKISYFIGAVGGNGGQALYLIGFYNQKIIFMDPHYVQSSETSEASTSTYFQSQPYCIEMSQLAPSIAFNFLVKSKDEYETLLIKLNELQGKHRPWVCLQIHSQELPKNLKTNSSSEDFFQPI